MKRVLGALVLAMAAGAAAGAAQVARPQLADAPLRNADARNPGTLTPLRSGLVQLSGVARTSTNAPVPFAPLRLRNARTGHIDGTVTADRAGRFSFGAVRPGYYVVEMLNRQGDVIAASPLVGANAGDVVSTVVKLPARIVPGAFLPGTAGAGRTASNGTIAVVIGAAASAGVLAVEATQPVSPEH